MRGQELRQGFGLITPAALNTAPAATAVFAYRQDGILVSEAGVPATHPTKLALAYAAVGAGLDTGLAIANPNDSPANVTLQVRQADGDLFSYPIQMRIPGHGQRTGFIDSKELFGSAVNGLRGTVTLRSDLPVAAVALRQRAALQGILFATLPFVDLETPAQTGPVVLPHVASGGGYETEVILINLGSDTTQVTVSFFQQDGKPANVLSFGSEVRSQYTMPVPAGGVVRLTTLCDATQPVSGYAVATPSDLSVPLAGLAVFSRFDKNILMTEASVPATTATRNFRIYVNETADRWSGLAIANPSSQAATLNLALNSVSGTALGSATLQIPAGQQIAQFAQHMLNGIDEETPGVLDVTSDVPVYPLALRLKVNERDNVLLTTLPVADVDATRSADVELFPQIALGEGWNTEVITVNSALAAQNGTISFSQADGSILSFSEDWGALAYQLAAGAATRIMSGRGGLIGSLVIPASGGILSAAGDERFTFAAGTFQSDTKVSLGALARGQAEDLLNFQFAAADLSYIAGFTIDSGNAQYSNGLTLSFGNAAGLKQDAQILIVRVVPDLTGDGIPDLALVDVAVLNGDRLESRSSSPLTGMRGDGEYLLLSAGTPVAFVEGNVTEADGSPAKGVAVTSFEQPRILALTDSSGNYILPVPAPRNPSGAASAQNDFRDYSQAPPALQMTIGNAPPGLYSAAVPFTANLTAAAPGLQRMGFQASSITPGAIPGTLTRPMPLQNQPLHRYLQQLCSNPDADLRKKVADLLEPIQNSIQNLEVPQTVAYDPLSSRLDCQAKTVPLSANLRAALAPERVNPALSNLLNSKISLTKWAPWSMCLSRSIQLADVRLGPIAADPTASSSNPTVADVISNYLTSDGDVITTVGALASGPQASITGRVSLVKIGYGLTYSVTACAQEDECQVQINTDDDLAFKLDWSRKPILLGPAYVAVGDMSGCTAQKQPVISLSPGSLGFSGTESGLDPSPQYLAVRNSGPLNSTLNYSVSKTASWLTLDGPLAPLASGESATLTVWSSLAGLAAGTYHASVTFTDPNATNSPQSVPVTLTVNGAGKSMQASPSSFAFSALQGGLSPAAQTLNVTSTGGALGWSAASDSSWLHVTSSTGVTPSAPIVSVNIAGLTAGSYNGRVTITAPGAINSPLAVPVTMTITAATAASLQVSPGSLQFNAQQGGLNPLSQALAVTSTGGTVSWSATSDSSWLILAPAGGTTPSSPNVSVNIAGLASGSYSGRITITAPSSTNSPLVVAVDLLVTGPSSGPLVFTAPSPLPPATVRGPYQFSFCQGARPDEACGGPFNPATSPTGGQPPYHFVLDTMGGFPPFGLVMDVNGLLSGTPTAAGTSTFRPCAVDLAGSQACQTVSLTVSDTGGSFTGTFSGSATDSKTFSTCVMKHTVSGTVTFNINGSGTAATPFTGTVSGNGTDVLTVDKGTVCFGGTISAAINGTVSGSAGLVQASAGATPAGGSTIDIEFSGGVIIGNTLTIAIRLSNEFFDSPITGTMTLSRVGSIRSGP